LAEGLAAAHEQLIVHRDLKPGNLMITPDGRLKILDFGLARLLQTAQNLDVTLSAATTTGVISGTVPYMSPEQLRGLPTDARSDIYAAGAVLYEMATGHRPFPQSQSAELMGAILHQTPDLPSSRNRHLSPALESVVMKALEKEPGQRYQSARELLVALQGVAPGGPARILQAGSPFRDRRSCGSASSVCRAGAWPELRRVGRSLPASGVRSRPGCGLVAGQVAAVRRGSWLQKRIRAPG